ncbi:uroporphyrinogen-III C-methyltransferase [Radiobacillus kanasensis]|uniref:uroporphyrinogen-III C-methyltransferase n=1 Tax=Radiobacillus kanasensis TaxID=2844358 RepID=UPI001E482433|nr:uroporphyrinogen-III C-methyltransferase [Radiobacillus kanasensis]UFT98045.1 uroporphyrinogen-III C-methyltransferase [Radiobacillus kanasensis]
MGKVYLVGAGPGDPELLTLKGLRTIKEADLILYDRLVNKELLGYAKPSAELIYCGKKPGESALRQDNINLLLCQFAQENKNVVRLKGGDPFIFGRGGEEALALQAQGIPFEIVPGITSGIAAPAYAGIPLTHRNLSSSVTFISGFNPEHETAQYWTHLVENVETLCIYMGVKKLPVICQRLLAHGMNALTPVGIIQWGTRSDQKTITGTLTDISHQVDHIQNPAMIVIGEVVRLREQLQWFEESKGVDEHKQNTIVI